MVLAAHPEDQVVAGEVDLDHDGPRTHLREQVLRVALEGERDAMAYAARPGDLDGLTDVEREIGGRDEAGPELAPLPRPPPLPGGEPDEFPFAPGVRGR